MVSNNEFQIVKFAKKYNFYLLDLQLPVQSVPITNNILSSNPAHHKTRCTRYNIMWQSLSVTCGRLVIFCRYSVSSTNKTNRHDITEIMLKMVLNTITLTLLCINEFDRNGGLIQEKSEDTKGSSEVINWRRTDDTMARRKRTKRRTMVYKTL